MTEKKYDFSIIKAIIGLGNPGSRHTKTRHNIGFRIVDFLADEQSATWQNKDNMLYTTIDSLYLIKPQTFMNNSGNVIPFLLKKGIKGDQLLVIHDDLEKTFGKMSIRWNGSARGHNGLRSIEEVIGKEYWRLRFGIGRPEDKRDVSNYVLSRFGLQEEERMDELLQAAVCLIRGDI